MGALLMKATGLAAMKHGDFRPGTCANIFNHAKIMGRHRAIQIYFKNGLVLPVVRILLKHVKKCDESDDVLRNVGNIITCHILIAFSSQTTTINKYSC